ncbi:unnamed protein product, partial [Symbiodinium necroappetens]
AVGDGEFTVDSDRARVGVAMTWLLHNKMRARLERGNFQDYRLLLNLRHLYLKRLPCSEQESLVPGFDAETAGDLPERFARFLHDNGFDSPVRPDAAGWTPICYAALNGDPALISELLKHKASPHDRIQTSKPVFSLAKHMTPLHLCALFCNNDAMKILISGRGDVLARDRRVATPLHWANVSNNVEGIKTLLAATADPTLLDRVGCAFASREAVMSALHLGAGLTGSNAQFIATLVRAGADVNEVAPLSDALEFKMLMAALRLKHQLRPTTLTRLAHHGSGATPLMISILAGAFEAVSPQNPALLGRQ